MRIVLSGWYEIGGSSELLKVSGGFGIALAALALHVGAALGLEDARRRELLPLFRRGPADEAFEGFPSQLARLERESGARRQL